MFHVEQISLLRAAAIYFAAALPLSGSMTSPALPVHPTPDDEVPYDEPVEAETEDWRRTDYERAAAEARLLSQPVDEEELQAWKALQAPGEDLIAVPADEEEEVTEGSLRQAVSSVATLGRCYVTVAQSVENRRAVELTNAGIQELLIGSNESAYLFLSEALALAPESVLARMGLLLTQQLSAEQQAQQTTHLREQLSRGKLLTPAEEAALGWMLRLSQGDLASACALLKSHCARFRNDVVSHCWAALLLHYDGIGYTVLGTALANQQQALDMAANLYARQQDHALVCFTRALVEEGAPVVSAEAQQAARRAAELLPEHPVVQQLCAHILYRAGAFQEAQPYADAAERLAAQIAEARGKKPEHCKVWLRARLYRISLLATLGKQADADKLLAKLNALPMDANRLRDADQLMLRWEAHTLPLRMLLMEDAQLTLGRIRSATKAATRQEKPNEAEDVILLHHARDCMSYALHAIRRTKSGQDGEAMEYLNMAERSFEAFKSAVESQKTHYPEWSCYWMRQYEACTMALYLVKMRLYPEHEQDWKTGMRDMHRPAPHLLPPVIPAAAARQEAAR